MDDGKVTFKLRNYRKDGKKAAMVLAVDNFIERFFVHLLPKGFRQIRKFGFLSK